MADKPSSAAGYRHQQTELVRATCLYVATKLGDLMEEILVIGGLVPTLLIDQSDLPPDVEPHVGTMDLDIGLTLTFFDDELYRTLTERLRGAGFSPDRSKRGHPTRQRWKIEATERVTIDFLIPPSYEEDQGGKLRDIEPDFAAVIAPGLRLAFRDRRRVELSGTTIFGERATRDVWVCGPGAYVVLKALAFGNRGENKDAYDLYYLVRNYGTGVEEVAQGLAPLVGEPEATEALEILRRDFVEHDAVGPRRVALFLEGAPDDVIQADVVGHIRRLLQLCRAEVGAEA